MYNVLAELRTCRKWVSFQTRGPEDPTKTLRQEVVQFFRSRKFKDHVIRQNIRGKLRDKILNNFHFKQKRLNGLFLHVRIRAPN